MKKRIRIAVIFAACAVLVCVYALPASALFNEEDAAHVRPADIENGTLAIGAHLIHISALTDELYGIASASAAESGQDRIYYKSELNGGAWCDITGANSLSAIAFVPDGDGTAVPTVVGDSIIAALFFTHHTKSDGITYDLRNNSPVNIFNIRSPYDLESMEELSPLKMQYDMFVEMENPPPDDPAAAAIWVDKRDEILKRTGQFWQTSVHTPQTDEYDRYLAALQSYYQAVAAEADSEDEIAAIQACMDSVDTARRVDVFAVVESALMQFIEDSMSVMDGSLTDSNLQAALGDSLANIQTAFGEAQGRMLSEGATILSSVRYRASTDLINHAAAGDFAACDIDVVVLVNLKNIENGTPQDAASEAALLQNELILRAASRLTEFLYAGESSKYKAAVTALSAGATLRAIAADNRGLLGIARGELEFFIDALTKRIPAEESEGYLTTRITLTQGWYAGIGGDAFFEDATACVGSHIEFLSKLKRQIELALGGSALDQLVAEKGVLQTEYLAALDNSDLAGAKAAEDQIAEIDDQIAAAEEETNAEISELETDINDLENELAGLDDDDAGRAAIEREIDLKESQLRGLSDSLSSDSMGKLAADLRNEALDIIENGGNTGALGDIIDSLGGLLESAPKIAFPALKDLYSAMQKKSALDGSSAFSGDIAKAEALLTDSKAAYDTALSGSKTAADLKDFIAGALASGAGGDTGGGTGGDTGSGAGSGADADNVALINALIDYADATGNADASNLAGAEALRQMNLGNPLVFKWVDDSAQGYLPVTAIRAYKGMRYVWSRNLNQATLARGIDYYTYTAYSDKIVRGKDKKEVEYMDTPSRFLGCVYLPLAYTEKTFECIPVRVGNTDLGVLMSTKLSEQSDGLLDTLMSS
ncbi:MAG: hypothetical protein LBS91_00505 [Clostridiales Family XIII bacterium]|nr:hypothetical protein [Clostridiales Family XIII bacterium]